MPGTREPFLLSKATRHPPIPPPQQSGTCGPLRKDLSLLAPFMLAYLASLFTYQRGVFEGRKEVKNRILLLPQACYPLPQCKNMSVILPPPPPATGTQKHCSPKARRRWGRLMRVRRRGALSRPRARLRPEARARTAGGKARGKPPSGSQGGGGRTSGVWNVPLLEGGGDFRAPLAFLPLLFADRSVSSPRRDPEPRAAATLPPYSVARPREPSSGLSCPLRHRSGALRHTVGRKFPRPEWRSRSRERGAAFHLPGTGGGVGPCEGWAA